MSVPEWTDDTYGIHQWIILWSSYRKLAWVGFEPMTTEFCLDALYNWAITPWVQLALRSNFKQLLHFPVLLSAILHFSLCLRISTRSFELKFCWINHMSAAEWTNDINSNHHWRIIWNSYRKLDWVGFQPTITEFRSDALND